ncbi:hypothetical protein BU23DRAFT_557171 [Bimuria novae-zelandiae CBS 107.79]|uniref:Rhodopsin domain-containing protein n=1 Tax=Bimuria novae-zelandiae CBS 107.79 TaxID=1447943 RepID=A0A6A5UZF4_9PLEO|nr:hypothetical protein BU23DRAFT_557171 [Bimuria novae-zelandiae CBS 107.79]
MSDAVQQDWPNQRYKILVSTTSLTALCTIFFFWRCVYGLKQRGSFLASDYLLIVSWALSIVNTVIRFILVDNGLGRHFKDPSITRDMIMTYSYWLWINQTINIVAVAVLKWSICAYLLVLDFSTVYRAIVWFSILVITGINFLAPVFTLFGCAPLEANWNRGITEKKCWAVGNLPLSYSQGVVNILTDVVYVVAPIVYLSKVQLPKRTQWGLRVVFLLSLIAMLCSIFKTVELKNINGTMDPTWTSADLSIWSGAELQVGIFIASLPPLHKVFDDLFRKYMPGLSNSGHKSTPLYGTPGQGYAGRSTQGDGIRMSTMGKSERGTRKNYTPGESVLDSDSESEKAILDDEERRIDESGIMKTTGIVITEGPRNIRHDNSPGSF